MDPRTLHSTSGGCLRCPPDSQSPAFFLASRAKYPAPADLLLTGEQYSAGTLFSQRDRHRRRKPRGALADQTVWQKARRRGPRPRTRVRPDRLPHGREVRPDISPEPEQGLRQEAEGEVEQRSGVLK